MRIHVSRGSGRKQLEFGDKKMIKGEMHVRCFATVNIGTPANPHYAYNCTGGRQRVDWVPESEVNMATLTRKRDH